MIKICGCRRGFRRHGIKTSSHRLCVDLMNLFFALFPNWSQRDALLYEMVVIVYAQSSLLLCAAHAAGVSYLVKHHGQ